MRTLQLHFPDDALAILHTVLKQTKDARIFRRAQAVMKWSKALACIRAPTHARFLLPPSAHGLITLPGQGPLALLAARAPADRSQSPVLSTCSSIASSSNSLYHMASLLSVEWPRTRNCAGSSWYGDAAERKCAALFTPPRRPRPPPSPPPAGAACSPAASGGARSGQAPRRGEQRGGSFPCRLRDPAWAGCCYASAPCHVWRTSCSSR
jgi:hypothetical protein